MKDKIIMTQNTSTYYVWIGGLCDGKDKEGVSPEAAIKFLFKFSGTICV